VYRTADGDLSDVPEGSVVALGPSFEGEFTGDLDAIAGIVVDAREGRGTRRSRSRTRRPDGLRRAAPESVTDGTVVTVDGERGVVYDGDVIAATQKR